MPAQTSAPWPPTGPTSIANTIPAYLYLQYQGDQNVAPFFEAYNQYTQGYVNWFNSINLPIYTQDPVSGTMLDWVAASIYGITRPGLPSSTGSPEIGEVNTVTANQISFNEYAPGVPSAFTVTDDDTFRRIITWSFYKGDGKTFTPTWLKRRINRFLNGANGTDVVNDTTYDVSVAPTGFRAWTITLTNTVQSRIFKAAVQVGALELPFQTNWSIVLV
jgi:hypothetical protein